MIDVRFEETSFGLLLEVRSSVRACRALLAAIHAALRPVRAVIERLEVVLFGAGVATHLVLRGEHGRPVPMEAKGFLLDAIVDALRREDG